MDPKLWETDNSVVMYRPFKYEYSFHGEILLRGTRIVVPSFLRNRFLVLAHESHPGVERMKRLLRGRVWWPGMDNDATEFVKKCTSCILVTKTNHCEPIKRRDLPTGPWLDLAIDFCRPLPSGHYLLVVIDYYSRFKEVIVMERITS